MMDKSRTQQSQQPASADADRLQPTGSSGFAGVARRARRARGAAFTLLAVVVVACGGLDPAVTQGQERATLSTSGNAAGAEAPARLTPVASVEGITEYRLDNGLRVLLFPDPAVSTITVNVTYLVGSVHEGYGESGMAHLLEHMLFKGTPSHPNIFKELQDRGASANGTTSFERTNYYETFDATDENLVWAIELEADRMVNSRISQEDLDSEMTVVRNEFERRENSPSAVVSSQLMSTAYLWHGYGKTPIGSRSDIENVPIERLRAFYEKYYQPDNAVLIVSGRIDETRTLELIQEHFGKIPRPERVLIPPYTIEPPQDGEREVVVRRVGDIQLLLVGYHLPAGAHPDFVPVQVATTALTTAPTGRLYKALVESGLAAQISAQELQLKDPGMLVFSAAIAPDKSVDAARAALFSTLAELEQNPLTDQEIERAKNRMVSSVEQSLNNSRSVALNLSDWVAMGDWRLLFLDRDRVRNATADDVRRVVRTYLKPANRTVAMFLPVPAPDRVAIPPAPDLVALLDGYTGDSTRSAGEAFDPSPANIQARTQITTLPGGGKLAMLPKETRGDVVNATIRLNFGTEESLAGTRVVAPLVGQMLVRGTQSRTREELRDELDRRQSTLGAGGGPGTLVATLRTTREHLLPMLELAIEVLREPAFPPAELETLRAAAIASTESERSDPQSIVQRAFARHWSQHYGPSSVHYVPTVDEYLADLRSVSVADLAAYHARFVGASNAEIAIVGDFDAATAAALLAERLGDWPSPLPYEKIVNPYPDPPIAPIARAFETPDKENAYLLAGMPIRISDESPDYPALVLGNYILGQGLNSRLFSRIRGTEGLSYSVGSQFSAQPDVEAGTFSASAIAAPQNVSRLEASLRDELTKVLTQGYSADEVAAAIASWTQGRQVSRSQDTAIVGLLLRNLREDRTMEWDEALERRVRELTPERIREAMSRHIDVDDMAFMTGGDFARVAD